MANELIDGTNDNELPHPDLANDPDTYSVTVTFQRSLAEDVEVARERFKGLPLKEALRRQLALELQCACDDGMAGFFNVGTVTLHESLTSEAEGQ